MQGNAPMAEREVMLGPIRNILTRYQQQNMRNVLSNMRNVLSIIT